MQTVYSSLTSVVTGECFCTRISTPDKKEKSYSKNMNIHWLPNYAVLLSTEENMQKKDTQTNTMMKMCIEVIKRV